MDKLSEIKKLLKEMLGNTTHTPFTAKVKSVEGITCTVEINGNLSIPNVRLRATANDGDNNLLITPKVGSKVMLLSNTGELDNLTVIKCDQVDKVEWKQDKIDLVCDSANKSVKVINDKTTIESSENKVSVNNDKVSLIDLFQMLSDTIKQLTVSTGTGPSGTPLPPTISQLKQFETKFKQLLK